LAAARLRHVCHLLAGSRRPYCPLNGVLALLPFASSENEVTANQVGAYLQRDLDVVHDSLDVDCPLFVMVCDLEQAPGCQEFLQQFPEEQRHRRLGVKLPPVPAADVELLPGMIEQTMAWICTRLVPTLVFRLLQVDRAGRDGDELRVNARLYEFLYLLRERHQLLARAIGRCVRGASGHHWQFGGCFLGATGSDSQTGQGFVNGIFASLIERQDNVTWTASAITEDARASLYSRIGYGGIAAAGIALLMCFLLAF
jgi:hypothetical protein